MPGVLNLGFLSFDTGIALYCFLLCVVVDPGRSELALFMTAFLGPIQFHKAIVSDHEIGKCRPL